MSFSQRCRHNIQFCPQSFNVRCPGVKLKSVLFIIYLNTENAAHVDIKGQNNGREAVGCLVSLSMEAYRFLRVWSSLIVMFSQNHFSYSDLSMSCRLSVVRQPAGAAGDREVFPVHWKLLLSLIRQLKWEKDLSLSVKSCAVYWRSCTRSKMATSLTSSRQSDKNSPLQTNYFY